MAYVTQAVGLSPRFVSLRLSFHPVYMRDGVCRPAARFIKQVGFCSSSPGSMIKRMWFVKRPSIPPGYQAMPIVPIRAENGLLVLNK